MDQHEPEWLKDAAYNYCCEAYAQGKSFLVVARKLTRLGVPRHRAKRMARHVIRHGKFLWKGRLTPLRTLEKEGK